MQNSAAENIYNAAGKLTGISATCGASFQLYFTVSGNATSENGDVDIKEILSQEGTEIEFEVENIRHQAQTISYSSNINSDTILITVSAESNLIPGSYYIHLYASFPGSDKIILFADENISLMMR